MNLKCKLTLVNIAFQGEETFAHVLIEWHDSESDERITRTEIIIPIDGNIDSISEIVPYAIQKAKELMTIACAQK